MAKNQKYISFIVGAIIFFLVYTVTQYLFMEGEINIVANIVIALIWSAGMLAFETWRKKKNLGL